MNVEERVRRAMLEHAVVERSLQRGRPPGPAPGGAPPHDRPAPGRSLRGSRRRPGRGRRPRLRPHGRPGAFLQSQVRACGRRASTGAGSSARAGWARDAWAGAGDAFGDPALPAAGAGSSSGATRCGARPGWSSSAQAGEPSDLASTGRRVRAGCRAGARARRGRLRDPSAAQPDALAGRTRSVRSARTESRPAPQRTLSRRRSAESTCRRPGGLEAVEAGAAVEPIVPGAPGEAVGARAAGSTSAPGPPLSVSRPPSPISRSPSAVPRRRSARRVPSVRLPQLARPLAGAWPGRSSAQALRSPPAASRGTGRRRGPGDHGTGPVDASRVELEVAVTVGEDDPAAVGRELGEVLRRPRVRDAHEPVPSGLAV